MRHLVVALDANLLIPIVSCDFLLTAFDQGLFEPLVSSTVLEEVERNLLDLRPDIEPDRLRRRVVQMKTALTDNIVETDAQLDGPKVINAKDRHIVRAAIDGGAHVLATNDTVLRVEITGAALDLEVLSGDELIQRFWASDPIAVAETIEALLAKRLSPPITAEHMAEQLRAHFPSTAPDWLATRPHNPSGR